LICGWWSVLLGGNGNIKQGVVGDIGDVDYNVCYGGSGDVGYGGSGCGDDVCDDDVCDDDVCDDDGKDSWAVL